ncbi:MAG TPA: ribosome-associated translation inhibitor RaiA [Trebonia sp.]|jgi:ribosomal subunit interface protein|nr:ribosome-associated translation inhibitor RaiA [Trebonia sp.]
MEITFTGRHTTVPDRFRRHASEKLAKLEKLDAKVLRVDVEVSQERNPRQADHSERVELTIWSRGPLIRAEAAADDRYAALDIAFTKLEGQLRRAAERRKARRGEAATVRSPEVLAAVGAVPAALDGTSLLARPGDYAAAGNGNGAHAAADGHGRASSGEDADGIAGMVPIQMEGDGPLVVREKAHASEPMTIDQALLEMELVGHDFYLFHDSACDKFSVVYRRRGYDYGVIRLVEEA